MKRYIHGLAAVTALVAGLLTLPSEARAEDPEINPYECLGRYESATGNRTISQIREEIAKRVRDLDRPEEPKSVNAMKHCVVAMLMSRAGDVDAPDHYEAAVENAPNEPGYELWWGSHYSMFRGARGPVAETAERHFYASLRKLEALRAAGKYRPHHAVVEEWTRKRLMVLYQQDGLHLIPGKQFPQSAQGLYRPGIAVGATVGINQDTRDFTRKGDWIEMRTFTTEADFADSAIRAGTAVRNEPYGRGLKPFEVYEIARAPMRYHVDAKLRYRQNPIGTLDFLYNQSHSEQSQITSFYFPAGCGKLPLCNDPFDGDKNGLNDVDVREIGGAFERVVPLYPVMDAKVGFAYKRVHRVGVVEFLPEQAEDFNMYDGKLQLSRFLGSDKLHLELGYAMMDIPDGPGPVQEQMREKHIRSALLEYALYSPLVLPKIEGGALGALRTPTRGWYFYAGAVLDEEIYGIRTVSKRDLFLGNRFEGSGFFDVTLQGTYATAKQTYYNADQMMRYSDAEQVFGGIRINTTPQFRIINPDALPGISSGLDSLMLVTPAQWDFAIEGRKDFANFRVGAELWAKLFLPQVFGPAFLMTAGYQYQNFYNLPKDQAGTQRSMKGIHIFQANLRLGWGDL